MNIKDYKVWVRSLSSEQFQQHLDGVLHEGEMNLRQNGYSNAKISSGMNQAAFADMLEEIIQWQIKK